MGLLERPSISVLCQDKNIMRGGYGVYSFETTWTGPQSSVCFANCVKILGKSKGDGLFMFYLPKS